MARTLAWIGIVCFACNRAAQPEAPHTQARPNEATQAVTHAAPNERTPTALPPSSEAPIAQENDPQATLRHNVASSAAADRGGNRAVTDVADHGSLRCAAEASIELGEGWLAGIARTTDGFLVGAYQSDAERTNAGETLKVSRVGDDGAVQTVLQERIGTFVHPDRILGAPALFTLAPGRYLAVVGSSGGYVARFFGSGTPYTVRLSEPEQSSSTTDGQADAWQSAVFRARAERAFAPAVVRVADDRYLAVYTMNVSLGDAPQQALLGVLFSHEGVLKRRIFSRAEDNAVAPYFQGERLFYLDARRAWSNLIAVRWNAALGDFAHQVVTPLSLASEPAQFAVAGTRVGYTAVGDNITRVIALTQVGGQTRVLSPYRSHGTARRVDAFSDANHVAWVFDDRASNTDPGEIFLVWDDGGAAAQRIASGRMPRVGGVRTGDGYRLGLVSVRRELPPSAVLFTQVVCQSAPAQRR